MIIHTECAWLLYVFSEKSVHPQLFWVGEEPPRAQRGEESRERLDSYVQEMQYSEKPLKITLNLLTL